MLPRPRGLALQLMMSPRKQPELSLGNLTAFERQQMMLHRTSWIFWEIGHQMHTACRVTRLLALTGGDSALMMSWFGLAGSCNNVLSLLISPVVGSLSDAVGRKWLVAYGRLGTAVFFMSSYLARTMRQQFLLNVLAWGVMMPGNIPAQQAMFDDLFGSRPQLAALINIDAFKQRMREDGKKILKSEASSMR